MLLSYSRWFVMGVAIALIGGCSNGTVPQREDAVESMEKVSAQLTKSSGQVNRTVTLLSNLESGGNLEKTFKEYTDAVSDLKSAGDAANKRAAKMREQRDQYMETWEKEAEKIENPDIKESLQQRREKVRANFTRISSLADDVRSAYAPFLKDSQEIQRALAVDLTPSGVKSLQTAISKTKAEGVTLASKLDALTSELNTLLGKLAPNGKQ